MSFATGIHRSWRGLIQQALARLSADYVAKLKQVPDWLPGLTQVLRAFSVPLDQVHYILFGESPYPRAISANGYAFWDQSVTDLWSANGFSKPVNRATSLRNFLKMLLVAEGQLKPDDVSSTAIAALDQQQFIQTLPALFTRLLNQGFLLLNASLVWHSAATVREDAKQWQPFMRYLLAELYKIKPEITLILWGNIAHQIERLTPYPFKRLFAPHPYNLSFIQNATMQDFFRPMHLLNKII